MITFSSFRKALKEAGLPSSISTIKRYERLGIISYPKNPIHYDTRVDRTYSDAEVKKNIEKIRHAVEFEGRTKPGRRKKTA